MLFRQVFRVVLTASLTAFVGGLGPLSGQEGSAGAGGVFLRSSAPLLARSAAGSYDGAGEGVEVGGFSELALGLDVEGAWRGRLWFSLSWLPGVVPLSGYTEDARQVSDPLGDLELRVGTPLVGPESPLRPRERVIVAPGVQLAVPVWRVDYQAQSARQEAGELYVSGNRGLHAWGLGAELRVAGASRALSVGEGAAVQFGGAGSLGWLRYLPMPYDRVSLEAYRRNELRRTLTGVEPFGRVDYGNRLSGRAGLRAELRNGIVSAGVEIGTVGWWRQPPRVDGGEGVADTDVSLVEGTLGLDLGVHPGEDFGIILEARGAISLAEKNTPAVSQLQLGVSTVLGGRRFADKLLD